MTKDEKKALLKQWKAKQEKKYILKKPEARSLFKYINKGLDKAPCDDTLKLTREWLAKKYDGDSEKIEAVISELDEDGGCCDCEVLMNCYERYELE